jgi:hypothetical protein
MMKNEHPIGMTPSIRYSHCHAFQPWWPARSNSIPYAMSPLNEPARAEAE